MTDNLLKMDNVNRFLKSVKSYSQFELAYEFLKFSSLNNEATNVKTGPDKVFDDKLLLIEGTACFLNNNPDRKDSTANASPADDSFEIREIERPKNLNPLTSPEENQNSLTTSDIYTFGGLLINTNNVADRSLFAYNMGTTANVVLLKDDFCYIANIGDSMAVLYKAGKAYKLNTEHKVTLLKERERIIKSGSSISNNRIDGRLNLSRAFGDFMHKDNPKFEWDKQAVTCCPEINKFKITSDMEFIVMGCDGIWDCVDVQKFCMHISKKLQEKMPLPLIIKEAFSMLLSKNVESSAGSDNMTCIIIQFNH